MTRNPPVGINRLISSFRGEYYFLSNFFPVKIVYEDVEYPSSEHAFQAAKTLDRQERLRIAKLPFNEIKAAGRKLKLRQDWDAIKIDVMAAIIKIKFSIPEMRDKLLATEGGRLVEGNTWNDRFWGQCPFGIGANNLGILLMAFRDELLFFMEGLTLETEHFSF